MAGLFTKNVKFIPGGIGVPRNLIFNASEFNTIATELKSNYTMIAKNTWSLDPLQMRIDKSRLPRYLSIAQFNHFASIVRPYYRKVRRGFGAEGSILYGLKPNLAYAETKDDRGTKIPTGARLSEEQYLALPTKFKPFYKRAEFRGVPYYYKVVKEKVPNIMKQAGTMSKDKRQIGIVRTPTVGIKKAPMGRWLEIE